MNVIRLPMRPRATSPPTTPPTITGVFGRALTGVVVPPPLLAVLEDVEREDSAPFILIARVTLNVSETYENILETAFTIP
jgi:hypothetical protein